MRLITCEYGIVLQSYIQSNMHVLITRASYQSLTNYDQLKSSILDPHGPFEVRNALRDVSPGATFNLNLRFLPSSEEKVCHILPHLMPHS